MRFGIADESEESSLGLVSGRLLEDFSWLLSLEVIHRLVFITITSITEDPC